MKFPKNIALRIDSEQTAESIKHHSVREFLME